MLVIKIDDSSIDDLVDLSKKSRRDTICCDDLIWINLANAVLGFITLVCVAAVGSAFVREFSQRVKMRKAAAKSENQRDAAVSCKKVTSSPRRFGGGMMVVSEDGTLERVRRQEDRDVDKKRTSRSRKH